MSYPPSDSPYPFVPYRPERGDPDRMAEKADHFLRLMDRRRSVRMFSSDPVPKDLVHKAIMTASTAPSGAHRQPWTFALIGDPETKHQIRIAAEEEEKVNYDGGRLPPDWREALEPLGTGWEKPYLDVVPWIVVLFEQRYGLGSGDQHLKHWYVKESIGIAAGMFIAALHHMGLATLPHTPSPMAFLTKLLQRPENERPFAMFPIGYPSDDCMVPDLARKPFEQVVVEF